MPYRGCGITNSLNLEIQEILKRKIHTCALLLNFLALLWYTARILLLSRTSLGSRPEVFCKKDVLKNFAKLTGKHLRSETLLKKKLWHSCFPVNFAKFLRTPLLQNTSGGCFCKILEYSKCQIGRMLEGLIQLLFMFLGYKTSK